MINIIIFQTDGTTRVIKPLQCENILKLVEAITGSDLKHGIKNWTSYDVT